MQDEKDIYIASSNMGDFVNRGENFEEFMMQKKEKMQKVEVSFYANSEFSLFDGKNQIPTPQLEELRKAILEKFSTMDLDDIRNSGVSQYEYRKIIGMKYQDIQLSQEDLNALKLYKARLV